MRCAACHYSCLRVHRFCGNCGVSLNRRADLFPLAPAPAATSPVAARGRTSPERLLAEDWPELKFATVLFADIVSSTEAIASLDADDAMRRLRPALLSMCRVVEGCGGTVLRTLGDGVMALFGVPRMLEDDATRACQAALQMQALFGSNSRGLSIRIGLHSGLIAVEPRKDSAVPGGGAHGLTVHVASRIMALARPGSIIMSDETAALVGESASLTSMGPFWLKGVPAALNAFELKGQVASEAPTNHLDLQGCRVEEELAEGPTRTAIKQRVSARLWAQVGARMDTLSAENRFLLQVCAVVGDELSMDLLRAVMGISSKALHEAMDALCQAGFLRAAGLSPLHGYVFRTPVLREIAFGMQIKARRSHLQALILSASACHVRPGDELLVSSTRASETTSIQRHAPLLPA